MVDKIVKGQLEKILRHDDVISLLDGLKEHSEQISHIVVLSIDDNNRIRVNESAGMEYATIILMLEVARQYYYEDYLDSCEGDEDNGGDTDEV